MPSLPARAPFGAAVFALAAASTVATPAFAQGEPDSAPAPLAAPATTALPADATAPDATQPPIAEPPPAPPSFTEAAPSTPPVDDVRVRGAAVDTLPAASGSGTQITAKE